MNKLKKHNKFCILIIHWIILCFGMNVIGLPVSTAMAQTVPVLNLPVPGTMVMLSPEFVPATLKGIKLFPTEPLRFDFIIDVGDTDLDNEAFKQESTKLIKYFLASLTIPKDNLWVNLSPYEKDRIIEQDFGQTEMGRDMLAQDYILKQLTSSLIYPEDDLGKEFWEKVYAKAYALYGTTDIPINTFNKVWIVPERAVIYENGDSAFVASSRLKVMMEQDYIAMSHQDDREEEDAMVRGVDIQYSKNEGAYGRTPVQPDSMDIFHEVVLPAIEQEVNEGQHFAQLRQIYNALILATWFKRNLKQSLLGHTYMSKNKIVGVDVDDQEIKEKIYAQDLEAYKKGVYDYIREDYDPQTEDYVPRQYFSGGTELGTVGDIADIFKVGTDVTPREYVQRIIQASDGELRVAQAFLRESHNRARNDGVRDVLYQIIDEVNEIKKLIEWDATNHMFLFKEAVQKHGRITLRSGGYIDINEQGILEVIDSRFARFGGLDHAGRGTYQLAIYATPEQRDHELGELLKWLNWADNSGETVYLRGDTSDMFGQRFQEWANGFNPNSTRWDPRIVSEKELLRRQQLAVWRYLEFHLGIELAREEVEPILPKKANTDGDFDVMIAANGMDDTADTAFGDLPNFRGRPKEILATMFSRVTELIRAKAISDIDKDKITHLRGQLKIVLRLMGRGSNRANFLTHAFDFISATNRIQKGEDAAKEAQLEALDGMRMMAETIVSPYMEQNLRAAEEMAGQVSDHTRDSWIDLGQHDRQDQQDRKYQQDHQAPEDHLYLTEKEVQAIISKNVEKLSSKEFWDAMRGQTFMDGQTTVHGYADRNGEIVVLGNLQNIRHHMTDIDDKIRQGVLLVFSISVYDPGTGDREGRQYKLVSVDNRIPPEGLVNLDVSVKAFDAQTTEKEKRMAHLSSDEDRLVLAIVLSLNEDYNAAFDILSEDQAHLSQRLDPITVGEYLEARKAYDKARAEYERNQNDAIESDPFYVARKYLWDRLEGYPALMKRYFEQTNGNEPAIQTLRTRRVKHALQRIADYEVLPDRELPLNVHLQDAHQAFMQGHNETAGVALEEAVQSIKDFDFEAAKQSDIPVQDIIHQARGQRDIFRYLNASGHASVEAAYLGELLSSEVNFSGAEIKQALIKGVDENASTSSNEGWNKIHRYWESISDHDRHKGHWDVLEAFSQEEVVPLEDLIKAVVYFTQFKDGTVSNEADVDQLLNEAWTFYKRLNAYVRDEGVCPYSERQALIRLAFSLRNVSEKFNLHGPNRPKLYAAIKRNPVTVAISPKIEFGFSGNAVDDQVLKAEGAVKQGDWVVAREAMDESIRLLKETDFEALDTSNLPLADTVNWVSTARWVIVRLDENGKATEEDLLLFDLLAPERKISGQTLKRALIFGSLDAALAQEEQASVVDGKAIDSRIAELRRLSESVENVDAVQTGMFKLVSSFIDEQSVKLITEDQIVSLEHILLLMEREEGEDEDILDPVFGFAILMNDFLKAYVSGHDLSERLQDLEMHADFEKEGLTSGQTIIKKAKKIAVQRREELRQEAVKEIPVFDGEVNPVFSMINSLLNVPVFLLTNQDQIDFLEKELIKVRKHIARPDGRVVFAQSVLDFVKAVKGRDEDEIWEAMFTLSGNADVESFGLGSGEISTVAQSIVDHAQRLKSLIQVNKYLGSGSQNLLRPLITYLHPDVVYLAQERQRDRLRNYIRVNRKAGEREEVMDYASTLLDIIEAVNQRDQEAAFAGLSNLGRIASANPDIRKPVRNAFRLAKELMEAAFPEINYQRDKSIDRKEALATISQYKIEGDTLLSSIDNLKEHNEYGELSGFVKLLTVAVTGDSRVLHQSTAEGQEIKLFRSIAEHIAGKPVEEIRHAQEDILRSLVKGVEIDLSPLANVTLPGDTSLMPYVDYDDALRSLRADLELIQGIKKIEATMEPGESEAMLAKAMGLIDKGPIPEKAIEKAQEKFHRYWTSLQEQSDHEDYMETLRREFIGVNDSVEDLVKAMIHLTQYNNGVVSTGVEMNYLINAVEEFSRGLRDTVIGPGSYHFLENDEIHDVSGFLDLFLDKYLENPGREDLKDLVSDDDKEIRIDIGPKKEFGSSGPTVDGLIRKAEQEVRQQNLETARQTMMEMIHLLATVNPDDLDNSGIPIADADAMRHGKTARWVIVQLDEAGKVDEDDVLLQLYDLLGPEKDLSGDQIKAALGYQAPTSESDPDLGGIDFNPDLLDIAVEGQAVDFDSYSAPEILMNLNIEGYTPVIFNIMPVTNLPLLLGFLEEEVAGKEG